MTAQITVTLPSFGPAPLRDNPATFDDNAESMMATLPPFRDAAQNFADQANALAIDVNARALAADNSANAAASAALAAGAVTWVSGTTYALNAAVVSPSNQLTYRKRTASSVSNTDPANDATNWKNVSSVGPVQGNLADSGASGTPITWDAGQVQVATLTLVGDRTIALPTNLPVGTLILHVKQDATGNRNLTFAAGYNFTQDVAPSYSKVAGERTVFSFVSDGASLWGSYLPGFKR